MAKTPKWEAELERLRQDPTIWESLKEVTRKTLIERGYADAQGNLIDQTPDAWYVEVWVTGDEDGKWIRQVSPKGESLVFDNPEEAKKHARQLSLLNNRIYRVCQYKIAPAFAVFEFGQRYIEDGLTHVRTRLDTELFEERDDDQDTTLYRHQSRLAGRSAEWGPPETHVYLDLSSAVETVQSLSKSHPRKDFRIIEETTHLAPQFVIYRAGAALPDVDVLDQMCSVMKASSLSAALNEMFILWKGADSARTLVEVMYQEFPRS